MTDLKVLLLAPCPNSIAVANRTGSCPLIGPNVSTSTYEIHRRGPTLAHFADSKSANKQIFEFIFNIQK